LTSATTCSTVSSPSPDSHSFFDQSPFNWSTLQQVIRQSPTIPPPASSFTDCSTHCSDAHSPSATGVCLAEHIVSSYQSERHLAHSKRCIGKGNWRSNAVSRRTTRTYHILIYTSILLSQHQSYPTQPYLTYQSRPGLIDFSTTDNGYNRSEPVRQLKTGKVREWISEKRGHSRQGSEKLRKVKAKRNEEEWAGTMVSGTGR